MAEEQNQQQTNPGTEAPDQQDERTSPGAVEPTAEQEMRYLGPIIGVLFVLLVLILGGLYIWGSMLTKDAEPGTIPRQIENNEPETPRAEADTQILNTVSSSDDIDAIEADLESTDLDSLDAELDEIDRELDAALQEL